MRWHLAWALIVLDCILRVLSIEHDSICTDDETCPEPSHTVMRLAHRDDKKARLLAKEHGMEVKVTNSIVCIRNHIYVKNMWYLLCRS